MNSSGVNSDPVRLADTFEQAIGTKTAEPESKRIVLDPNDSTIDILNRQGSGAKFWRGVGIALSSVLLIYPGVKLYQYFQDRAKEAKDRNTFTVDRFLNAMEAKYARPKGQVDSPEYKEMLQSMRSEIGGGRSLTQQKAAKILEQFKSLEDRGSVSGQQEVVPSRTSAVVAPQSSLDPKLQSVLQERLTSAWQEEAKKLGLPETPLTRNNLQRLQALTVEQFKQDNSRPLQLSDMNGIGIGKAIGSSLEAFKTEQQSQIQTSDYAPDLEVGFQLEKRELLRTPSLDNRPQRLYHLLSCGRSKAEGVDKDLRLPSGTEAKAAFEPLQTLWKAQHGRAPQLFMEDEGEGSYEGKYLEGLDPEGRMIPSGHIDGPNYHSFAGLGMLSNAVKPLNTLDASLEKAEKFCLANQGHEESELRSALESSVGKTRGEINTATENIRDSFHREGTNQLGDVLDFKPLPRPLAHALYLRHIPEDALHGGESIREKAGYLLTGSFQRPAYFRTGESASLVPEDRRWNHHLGEYIIESSARASAGIEKVAQRSPEKSGVLGDLRTLALGSGTFARNEKLFADGLRNGIESLKLLEAGSPLPEPPSQREITLENAVGHYCGDSPNGRAIDRGLQRYQRFATDLQTLRNHLASTPDFDPKAAELVTKLQQDSRSLAELCGQGGTLDLLARESADPNLRTLSREIVRLHRGSVEVLSQLNEELASRQRSVGLEQLTPLADRDRNGYLRQVTGKAVFAAATRSQIEGTGLTGHNYLKSLKPDSAVTLPALRDLEGGRATGGTNDSDKLVILGSGNPLAMVNTDLTREQWTAFTTACEKQNPTPKEQEMIRSISKKLLRSPAQEYFALRNPSDPKNDPFVRLALQVGRNELTAGFASDLRQRLQSASHNDPFPDQLLSFIKRGQPGLAQALLHLEKSNPNAAHQFANEASKSPNLYTNPGYSRRLEPPT